MTFNLRVYVQVESYRNSRRLAKIAHYVTDVDVLRDGQYVTLSSPHLVRECDVTLAFPRHLGDDGQQDETSPRQLACAGLHASGASPHF